MLFGGCEADLERKLLLDQLNRPGMNLFALILDISDLESLRVDFFRVLPFELSISNVFVPFPLRMSTLLRRVCPFEFT